MNGDLRAHGRAVGTPDAVEYRVGQDEAKLAQRLRAMAQKGVGPMSNSLRVVSSAG